MLYQLFSATIAITLFGVVFWVIQRSHGWVTVGQTYGLTYLYQYIYIRIKNIYISISFTGYCSFVVYIIHIFRIDRTLSGIQNVEHIEKERTEDIYDI